jgi:hypothetical protein
MKLIIECSKCRKEMKIKALLVDDRIGLAQSKGKEFKNTCSHCGHTNTVDVDKVFAIESYIVPIIGFISVIGALIITILLWDFGFVSTLSFAFPIVAVTSTRKNQRNNINAFNLMYYDSKSS